MTGNHPSSDIEHQQKSIDGLYCSTISISVMNDISSHRPIVRLRSTRSVDEQRWPDAIGGMQRASRRIHPLHTYLHPTTQFVPFFM
ncbi:hypothetical protein VTO42DRAFT_4931 [Malbranchea cinnamomea]